MERVPRFAHSSHPIRQRFIPAGLVTGIGSLPFTSVSSAIQSVAEFSPAIPFWPQLPQRSEQEGSVAQALGAVADLVEPRQQGYGYQVKQRRIDALVETLHRSTGELAEANAACFRPFEQALSNGLFPSAVAVKGQIQGPITLSAYLFHQGRPFLSDPALFAAVAFHVSQIVCWQIARVRSAGLPVLLFIDEPGLCLDASGADSVREEMRFNALAATLEDVRMRGAYAGLHCCAARPFERMCLARPDILSFDAHEGLDLFFASAQALEFVKRGGMVAYGVVPTKLRLDAVDAAGIFVRWLKAATLAGDPQELAQRAMITATCGLGLLDQAAVAESFGVAHSVGKLIRTLAGLSAD